MNILFVDLGAVWGGQEIYSLNLMSALRSEGHFVVSVSSNGKHKLSADMYCYANTEYLSFISLSKLVRELVIKYGIDVVHVNGNRAMYLAPLLRVPVKLVATKHLPFFVGLSRPLKHRFARWLSGWLFSALDHIICVAGATYDDLPNVCKEKASVIPNGVPDKRAVLARISGDEEVKLCYVARLVEHKGILPLMHGVVAAVAAGAVCHLSIAGDGPLREDVEALVKTHPQLFSYHGFVADPAGIYNQADICCLPSLSEGMPLNILEAFSCGLPVLAVDIPGVNEVVNSRNGWLLSDNSSETIAREVKSICMQVEDISKKSSEARLNYECCYSVDLMTQRTLDIYGR